MAITHIEVLNDKGHTEIKSGQLLKVVRETPCFYWVKSFGGTEFQVSKRTKRINGTKTMFLRAGKQPLMNL